MNKKVILLIVFWLISVPFIVFWIFQNCFMKLDFSNSCINEQTSKWFAEWLNNFQENINRGLLLTWWVSDK